MAQLMLSEAEGHFCCFTHTFTHTQPFYGSVDFVQDNPGEPVPEETFLLF